MSKLISFTRDLSAPALTSVLLFVVCVYSNGFVLQAHAENQKSTVEKEVDENAWQPEKVMQVTVINAETREPLPGVSLELQNMGKGIKFNKTTKETTGADGVANITHSKLPPTAVRIYPSKKGFVTQRIYWEAEPSPVLPETLAVELEPGKKIGGIIRDEDEEPIAGVKVNIEYWGPRKGKNPDIRANIGGDAKTDENGRWLFDEMTEEVEINKLRLYVNHPDYVSDHLSRGYSPRPIIDQPPLEKLFDQSSVMEMRKGISVRGRVVDAQGNPIPNVEVYPIDNHSPVSVDNPRTKTDKAGAFVIGGLDPKAVKRVRENRHSLWFTFKAKGYAPNLMEVDPNDLDSPVAVELAPGRPVRGKVVDEDGKPVKGAYVSVSRWRIGSQAIRLHTKSDADGKFQLDDVPADDVVYDIGKQGYMMVEEFQMTPGDNEYTIKLGQPLRVSGSVIDAETGKPLDEFVFVDGHEYDDGRAPQWNNYKKKTIRNGRYESTYEQVGFPHRIRVEAKGYMPGESPVMRADDPDNRDVTYDFKLKKADPFSGTVVGLDGKPLADAKVYRARQRMNINNRKVSSVAQWDRDFVTTKKDGRFEFPPEVEPFCLVVVHKDGLGMVTEKDFAKSPQIKIEPWEDYRERLQIVRRPTPGQSVDFPPPPPPEGSDF